MKMSKVLEVLNSYGDLNLVPERNLYFSVYNKVVIIDASEEPGFNTKSLGSIVKQIEEIFTKEFKICTPWGYASKVSTYKVTGDSEVECANFSSSEELKNLLGNCVSLEDAVERKRAKEAAAKEALAAIEEKTSAARALLKEAEKIAKEKNVSFYFDLGSSEYYDPKNGWQNSSSNC